MFPAPPRPEEYYIGWNWVRGVGLEEWRSAYDGGCLCVFSNNLGLVLSLCCVPEGIARRGVDAGTTASDRKDLIAQCQRMGE